MLEKQFQQQINQSINLYCHNNDIKIYKRHKFPDTGIWKTPYDCYVRFYPSKYVGLELKVCRQKATVNFKYLFKNRYHEIQELKKDILIGDTAWVLIAHKKGRQYTSYAVTPDKADEYYHQGSVKLADMDCIELERVHNPSTNELLYNLTPLMR